jgi:hypothetical protein
MRFLGGKRKKINATQWQSLFGAIFFWGVKMRGGWVQIVVSLMAAVC